MEVYEFDKCLLERLDECISVLSWKDKIIPPAQVRNEWAYFVELQIEPAGWQALWKVPRVICEELNLRYPTIVFGTVEQVLFRDLKAVFVIEAVQDDDVHLPERHEVALEDLHPTLNQENSALNVDRTANVLDRLRFFYTNVWMPWDGDIDEDVNWPEKHLESRIRFYYDLRKRTMKPGLVTYIRSLIAEARYLQERRDYILLDHSDKENDHDALIDQSLNKSEITDLMRWHLRMAIIRNEIEIFENPQLRRIYEDTKFDNEKYLNHTDNEKYNVAFDSNPSAYIVTIATTFEKHFFYLSLAKKHIPEKTLVKMCPTLQNVLNTCHAYDKIYLPPGTHTIKSMEHLYNNGSIIGLMDSFEKNCEFVQLLSKEYVILTSPDYDSVLLVFDGNFILENLVLDCEKIRTGILLKNGKVCLRNCRIIGNGKSSTQQGIILRNGEMTLQNCLLEKFAVGITTTGNACLNLIDTSIKDCSIGIEINQKCAKIKFKQTNIINATKYGIYVDALPLAGTEEKGQIFGHLDEINNYYSESAKNWKNSDEISFGNCKQNIYVMNAKMALIPKKTLFTFED